MIVVTGASGLLGASVLCRARDTGRHAAGVYHRHPLHIPGTQMLSVDLTDTQAMRQAITRLRPESIVHCAAATNLDWCEDHPDETQRINVEVSSGLAEIARDLQARLVYISTDAVFDGRRGNYSESDVPAPLSVYARSKLDGERVVLARDPSALIVRVNIYGWNAQEKQSLAEWILGQLAAQRQVPGFTDVYFCPLLANDLAETLFAMLDRRLSGMYHVAGSERTSKYEFARRAATTFGFDPDCVTRARLTDARLKAPRSPDTSLNTSKIAAALGSTMPDVESGLRRFRALKEEGYVQQLKASLAGARA